MSEHQNPGPDELERRVGKLREAMSRMSTDELCDLMHEIQVRMRESAKPEAK
jgi:hypothetical protein